ncbi:unnamed protein product [Thelazia callipaeda]|uniref:Torsin n=1 Tax=Thelazia callipaeda TaxID=103827 RepID=A0A0N5D1J2_THECL|nr:unnamed protein product [Thelazia callipaeda]
MVPMFDVELMNAVPLIGYWRMIRQILGLQHVMRTRLYGQHIAEETVLKAVIAHWRNPNPKKALVMSFHGWTGCGKNYLSTMIADNLYVRGARSDFFHVYISTLHFSSHTDTSLYQEQLRSWIRGNVSLCERTLFVFDEMDKMPAKLIDGLKPFIDHYNDIESIDFRKSIFIFISNSGSNEIAQKALQHYESGKIREELTLKDMEDVLMGGAFNTEGGLKMSHLISAHLIDHFVPFLPLERRHVLLCIKEYMSSQSFEPTAERIRTVADSLQYFPKTNPIYSASGCKRVAQKVELLMFVDQEERRRHEDADKADNEL